MPIIITFIAFILLILVMVWLHFLKQVKRNSIDIDLRKQTNKNLYHEHKAEIEADFQQQKIDEENYQYLLAELDKSFIQDMEENQTQFIGNTQQLSVLWPIGISVFIFMLSFFLYQKTGAFEQLSKPKITAQTPQQQTQPNTLSRIDELKEQLTQTPNSTDLWYALGQELVLVGAFDAALASFDKAIAIEGQVADLIGAKAQAAYYKNNQQITPEVQQLIDQALAVDKNDASTNILLGMHAFSLTDYQAAINYWQRMIDSSSNSVNEQALTDAINEAKRRLGIDASADEVSDKNGVNLLVNVTLSPKIKAKLIAGNDPVVFIYAIPADGPRMPVAAVKTNASALPVVASLNDSNAMTPEMTISRFDEVTVFAVISHSGSPGIQAGDFQGEINRVNPRSNNTVSVVIDTVVQ